VIRLSRPIETEEMPKQEEIRRSSIQVTWKKNYKDTSFSDDGCSLEEKEENVETVDSTAVV